MSLTKTNFFNRSTYFFLLISTCILGALAAAQSAKAAEIVTVKAGRYQVINVASDDTLNVRKSPSLKSEVVATLPNRTLVKVTGNGFKETKRTWVEVAPRDGVKGWVNQRYLKFVSLPKKTTQQTKKQLNKTAKPIVVTKPPVQSTPKTKTKTKSKSNQTAKAVKSKQNKAKSKTRSKVKLAAKEKNTATAKTNQTKPIVKPLPRTAKKATAEKQNKSLIKPLASPSRPANTASKITANNATTKQAWPPAKTMSTPTIKPSAKVMPAPSKIAFNITNPFAKPLVCYGIKQPGWRLDFVNKRVRYIEGNRSLYVWPQFTYKKSEDTKYIWWLAAVTAQNMPKLQLVMSAKQVCKDSTKANQPMSVNGLLGQRVISGCCYSAGAIK